MATKPRREYAFRDPTFLTKLVVALLLLRAMVDLGATWSSWQQTRLFERVRDGATIGDEEAEANDDRQAAFGLTQVGTSVLVGIAFMIWTYRVVANAHCSSRYAMKTTPGWAVGYYFIPILNIWKPFTAIRDADALNARRLGRRSNAVLLYVWWVSWLIAGGYSRFAARKERGADTVGELLDMSRTLVMSDVADFVVALVAAFMVSRVGRASAATGAVVDESAVFA